MLGVVEMERKKVKSPVEAAQFQRCLPIILSVTSLSGLLLYKWHVTGASDWLQCHVTNERDVIVGEHR